MWDSGEYAIHIWKPVVLPVDTYVAALKIAQTDKSFPLLPSSFILSIVRVIMSPSSLDTLALSDYFQDVDDRQDAVSRKRKHDSEEWPSAGGDNPLLSPGPLDDDFVASILSLLQMDKCSSDVEDFAINHQNGPEDDSMQQLFAIMHQLNARAPLSASSANAPIDQPLIASQESRPLRRRKTVPDNLPTTDFCAPPSSVIPDHQENAMMDTDWFLLGTNDVALSPTLTSPSASSSSSSSILSPPISPIQPGELLLSAPPSQDEQAEDWMPLVKQYLSAESSGLMLSGERTVIILTGKVAQKSYGTEKRYFWLSSVRKWPSFWLARPSQLRFLSPPPTTLLLGPWQQPNGLLIRIGTENSQPIAGSHPVSGTLEWFDAETGRPATPFFHHYSSAYGKCVAKHLHITDAAEKRRQVQVLLDLQLGGQSLGVLPSRNIKVISKPSKKKQSKHLERKLLCSIPFLRPLSEKWRICRLYPPWFHHRLVQSYPIADSVNQISWRPAFLRQPW